MQKHIGWLWFVGFFGLVAAADAQTPSPPTATTQFDGTYLFVSGTKVNETYLKWSQRVGQFPDKTAGPITNCERSGAVFRLRPMADGGI